MPPRQDGAATPTTSPPSSPGGTPSSSKGAGAGAAPPPSSPHPTSDSEGSSAAGGVGTGDVAAAPPPSPPHRSGSPPVASTSPSSVSCPASPRVHCGGSTPKASPFPASASCNTSPRVRVSLLELVATVRRKPAAGAHDEGEEVEKPMDDPVKTPALSDSEKQLSFSPAGTAAATPPSSLRCCGIPSAASTSPASASSSTSPRVHCGGSTPTASPFPLAGESAREQVATDHGKPEAGAHEKEGVVASVMEQTTGSELVKTTVLFNPEQREGTLNQWEQDLAGRAEEVEQREDAAVQRERRQYDMWLRLAEWETDLRRAQHAVLQGHTRLSKWVNDVDAEWTTRMTTAPRMEDELRSEKSRTEAKQKEEKGDEDDEKEEEVKHAHGCFGSGSFRWNFSSRAEPRDKASAALKQRLLMPQQSQSMPTPSDTPNPLIAEITAMTMRNSTPKAKVYHFESCLMPLRSERPKTYGICAFPSLGQITSENKDPEMVKIGLRVLTRSSENLDERRLYSTIHEILKAVIAKYDASLLITEQERVRWEIRKMLTDQAQNFGIAIDGVSIVSLSFEKVFTQDMEEKELTTQAAEQDKRTTQQSEQDNRSAMIKSQEDDQIWNKRQIGYIFDLGTALGVIFLIRPWLPSGYDRWILAAFAAIRGAGSVGLPFGMFGTSRLEKNCSRHVGRLISLSFSLLVIYAIYILTLNVAGTPSTPSVSSFGITNGDGDGDADCRIESMSRGGGD